LVLGALVGVFLSSYYLKKTPKQFESTATLLVKQSTSAVINRDEVEDIDMRSDDAMNTIAAQVSRVELVEKVARRPEFAGRAEMVYPAPQYLPEWAARFLKGGTKGTEADQSELSAAEEDLVEMLQKRLSVTVRRRTRLLDVTVSHEEAELARALADAFVEEYLKELAEVDQGSQSRRSQGLLNQAEEARQQLQDANSALAVYKRALEAHGALELVEEETQDLGRRYRAKHPKMIAAVAKLSSAKSKFLGEFRVAASSAADKSYWDEAKVELSSVEADADAELATARKLLLARTQVLDGETKSRMSVFNSILVALEEAKVNSIDEDVIADLHSRAMVAEFAAFPSGLRVYAAGGMGGVACGVGLIFLLLRIDNRFRTVAQVEEETGMPVLSAVPVLEARKIEAAEKSHNKKEKEDGGAEAPSEKVLSLSPDVVFRDGLYSSLYAESYRILRAAVMLLGDEKERKISTFSSALPGEGKTTTSTNYALATASQGKKTLLMDMDLRKPKVHRQFNLRRSELGKGMSEVLSNQCTPDEALTKTPGIETLDAIFAGGNAPNPGELLQEKGIRKLFDWAREHYDHIVIDTAPVLAVPDTRIILPLVNNPILVVRANVVPKPAVFRALEMLEDDGSRVVGIVLNGYRETRRLLGYNYSYGSYRYGKYGYSQYGYGGYGSYGSYGSDDSED
tara:strand:- start:4288 stop:6336 length:2049 start_codon:yes stop_codon:yes gene_type:complete